MYCPQCGTESQSAAVQYCRVCGANLKVIGKAVSLSEAIARSDRGPMPKLKEMVKSLNVEHVGEEVSKALDRMNQELTKMSSEKPVKVRYSHGLRRKKKTPEERREDHIAKGLISLFSGVGLTIFLYFLSAALVLKLPPDLIAKIPFEIDPVVRILWWIGFVPTLKGIGQIFAGLSIRPRPVRELKDEDDATTKVSAPSSVTERTTNLLEHNY